MRNLLINKIFSEVNGGIFTSKLSNEELMNLRRATGFLPVGTMDKIRAQYVLQGHTMPRHCDVCGETIVEDDGKGRLKRFCSRGCSAAFIQKLPKVRATFKITREGYGEEKKIQMRIAAEATSIKNFGCRNPAMSQKVKEKIKSTCLKRYGSEYSSCNLDVRAKRSATFKQKSQQDWDSRTKKSSQTCMDKYGVINAMRLQSTKAKMTETNMAKYGVGCVLQNPSVKAKIKSTCMEKYGTEFPQSCPDVRAKMSESAKNPMMRVRVRRTADIKKYGPKNLKLLQDRCFVEAEYSEKTAAEMGREFGVTGCTFANRWLRGHSIPLSRKAGSVGERELLKFVRCLLGDTTITSSRAIIPPQELDILIPKLKTAIEYNGVYWHRSEVRGSSYHRNKLEACNAVGITLLQVWESEWRVDRTKAIWKSVIAMKIGIVENKLMARKCKVETVSAPVARKFYDKAHLQGGTVGGLHYGLTYKGELVCCMSFGKNRFGGGWDWELLRFCSSLNTQVIGGASRLLSRFRKEHTGTIVSYANRRWSNGGLYEKLGFRLVRETAPNYFYFKGAGTELHSRHKFQKHKLPWVLEEFNEELTEVQNMRANGYHQIHDAGNLVFGLP